MSTSAGCTPYSGVISLHTLAWRHVQHACGSYQHVSTSLALCHWLCSQSTADTACKHLHTSLRLCFCCCCWSVWLKIAHARCKFHTHGLLTEWWCCSLCGRELPGILQCENGQLIPRHLFHPVEGDEPSKWHIRSYLITVQKDWGGKGRAGWFWLQIACTHGLSLCMCPSSGFSLL